MWSQFGHLFTHENVIHTHTHTHRLTEPKFDSFFLAKSQRPLLTLTQYNWVHRENERKTLGDCFMLNFVIDPSWELILHTFTLFFLSLSSTAVGQRSTDVLCNLHPRKFTNGNVNSLSLSLSLSLSRCLQLLNLNDTRGVFTLYLRLNKMSRVKNVFWFACVQVNYYFGCCWMCMCMIAVQFSWIVIQVPLTHFAFGN